MDDHRWGAIFLVVKSFEWSYEIGRATPCRRTFLSFYYTAAGLHGLHVIGMIAMGLVAMSRTK